MAKRSAKQIANQKKFARTGWVMSGKVRDESGRCGMLHTDFDPPAHAYISNEELKYLLTPAHKG